jgi:Raf kinase inhibitor-like YbhB/YbcL family protein
MATQAHKILTVTFLLTAITGCRHDTIDPNIPASISLTSESFQNNQPIPQQFTCKGANISPQLSWQSLPPSTKTLALTVTDSHSVFGPYIHWVLYNLPPQPNTLPTSLPRNESLPNGAKQGLNSNNKSGYAGPCPSGTSPHHYVFTLYALDTTLTSSTPLNSKQLADAMKTHILATGQLTGQFPN